MLDISDFQCSIFDMVCHFTHFNTLLHPVAWLAGGLAAGLAAACRRRRLVGGGSASCRGMVCTRYMMIAHTTRKVTSTRGSMMRAACCQH